MFYETTFIISPEVDQEKIAEFWGNIIQKAKGAGLEIVKEIRPYSRALAYPIAKKKRGYVATFYISTTKDAPGKVKELIGSNKEILRAMIFATGKLPEARTPLTYAPRISARTVSKQNLKRLKQGIKEVAKEELKEAKPSIEEIDKKLEDILGDKIGF